MLKITWWPDELAPDKNDSSRPTFENHYGNGEVNRFGGNYIKYIKKLGKLKKLFKLGNLKGEKLFKFQKSAKSGKKLSKSENLPNFNAKKNGSSFLTPKARVAFNYLWLAFIESLILLHFNLKCHIWIKTDVSGYTIGRTLSQLTSGTSPDEVITKANLG